MINILSYVGMNMQSEVCLWTLLGLVRTIFDATLFKVNANLKQVWQMTMPEELSMPVQRVLRTMISGVMLVQCFTVYVYLASYIVLLYPVFLEERPTLVLPWLLLAAIRKLLCELTSLALGLGTCVLLGPARPPCIKFVVVKFASIMPAFYMWMLVFSYYHALKVAAAFKTFPAVLPPNDNDYGLELAVRRRRTKSLFGEEQLRKKLVANFYGESSGSITNPAYIRTALELSSRIVDSPDTSAEDDMPVADSKPLTVSTTGWSDIGSYEDWFGSEVMIPRDTDRILEQIVLMLLRIGAYLKKDGLESIIDSQILNSAIPLSWLQRENMDCSAVNADETDTPPLVGSSRGNMASYLREYPQIFMKKASTDVPPTERKLASLKTVHSHVGSEDGNTSKSRKRVSPDRSAETLSINAEHVASKKKISISDILQTSEVENDKLLLPKHQKPKKTSKINEGTKKQNKSDSECQFKVTDEVPNGVQNGLEVYRISSSERGLNEASEAFSSRTSVQQTATKIYDKKTEIKKPVKDNIKMSNAIQKTEILAITFKRSKESLKPTTSRLLHHNDSSKSDNNTDVMSDKKDLEVRCKNNDIRIEEKHELIPSVDTNTKTTKTTSNDALVHYQHINELDKEENNDSESKSNYDIEVKYKVKNGFKSNQISLNENKNNERTQATSSHVLDQHSSTQSINKQDKKESESQTNNDIENTNTAGYMDENKIHLKVKINDESTNVSSSREQHTSAQNSDEVENNETKPSPDKDKINKSKAE